eukprot:357028-Chlamydomonas_euryale.AAC.1
MKQPRAHEATQGPGCNSGPRLQLRARKAPQGLGQQTRRPFLRWAPGCFWRGRGPQGFPVWSFPVRGFPCLGFPV